jgi:hypothetical protein
VRRFSESEIEALIHYCRIMSRGKVERDSVPVRVTWHDYVGFCEGLSGKEGKGELLVDCPLDRGKL